MKYTASIIGLKHQLDELYKNKHLIGSSFYCDKLGLLYYIKYKREKDIISTFPICYLKIRNIPILQEMLSYIKTYYSTFLYMAEEKKPIKQLYDNNYSVRVYIDSIKKQDLCGGRTDYELKIYLTTLSRKEVETKNLLSKRDVPFYLSTKNYERDWIILC